MERRAAVRVPLKAQKLAHISSILDRNMYLQSRFSVDLIGNYC